MMPITDYEAPCMLGVHGTGQSNIQNKPYSAGGGSWSAGNARPL